MQLNYFICKHFNECKINADCIFAPDKERKTQYPCLSFKEKECDDYLKVLFKNKRFVDDLKRHLFVTLRAISYKLTINAHIYYVVELDEFKIFGVSIEDLLKSGNPKNVVKDYTYLKILNSNSLLRNGEVQQHVVSSVVDKLVNDYLNSSLTKKLF